MPQPPLQLSYMGEQPLILSDDHTSELRAYLDVLLRHAWMIGWVTLIVTLLGTLYAFTARPVYETSLMVQVEEKGQRDPKNILETGAEIGVQDIGTEIYVRDGRSEFICGGRSAIRGRDLIARR